MRIELVIILVVAFFVYDTYYDGKYTSIIRANKKKLQIVGYIVAGISLYMLIRKDPVRGKQMLLQANNTIKYLPIDKTTTSVLSPIIDFTVGGSRNFMGTLNPPRRGNIANMEQKILQNSSNQSKKGGKATKRSVSETKKKYVASMQDWKCGDCHDKLNAWFEVDHKTRLEYGGSNDVDNLVALCRNCHGKKTAFENM